MTRRFVDDMTAEEKHSIAIKMMRHGSGFSSKLGDMYTVADSTNRRRIEQTWPELFEKYSNAPD
jgi:hypothetical protein